MILQKNPLTVCGRIEKCWLFTFRTPVDAVRPLVPERLELLERNGFAFWNVVACEVAEMRPKGLPPAVGLRFRQVAYRLYVRYKPNGTPIEGLYFLRSDCDRRLLTLGGRLLTDFRFHRSPIELDRDTLAVGGEMPAEAEIDRSELPTLPEGSAFDSLYQAKAVLKYNPCGIAPTSNCRMNVVSILRDEKAWVSRLVAVKNQRWKFFDGLPVEPEICYEVEPVEYQWNRGRLI